MAQLEAQAISKTFESNVILDNVSLTVEASEFLVIVGRSGTGKTTLLRILAGLEQPDSGSVYLEGELVPGPKGKLVPGHEEIKIAHQGFDLHPHMSAKENIERSLLAYQDDYREYRTSRLLRLADLEHATKARPRELSGGQQQKLAIATALATEPKVLLLDEPFSNLDPFSRDRFLQEIKENAAEQQTSIILVTHDTREALSVADRILVLEQSGISQEGTPEQVYRAPATQRIANFFGRVNYFDREEALRICPELSDRAFQQMGFRPMALRFAQNGPIKGEVSSASFQGSHYLVTVGSENGQRLFIASDHPMEVGAHVRCVPLPDQAMLF